jgi:hypothetical protein
MARKKNGDARRESDASPFAAFGIHEGDAVILYLQAPKEKVWGLLLQLHTAGIVMRCIELGAFEDWMRQEARGDEPYLGLTTIFYPMGRVERMEKDEDLGPMASYAARFEREVGRTVRAVLGLEADED